MSVPALALVLYAVLGNPNGMVPGADADPHIGQQELEGMVNALAQRMEKEPGNLKGWAMLARSYKALGRNQDAERAFEKAGAFIDDDAQMLANYADVAASNAGGNFAGKPALLIQKALKADPQNAMALWLSGTEALSRKDYDQTLAIWGRLAPQLTPGSDDERMLQGAIDEVRARAGKPALAAAPAEAPKSTVAKAGAAAGAGVSGVVDLDPALKAKAAPTDIVMVIARLPGTRDAAGGAARAGLATAAEVHAGRLDGDESPGAHLDGRPGRSGGAHLQERHGHARSRRPAVGGADRQGRRQRREPARGAGAAVTAAPRVSARARPARA